MKLKPIIVICEPHSDDSYLSCHQHIVDWIKAGHVVIIQTILSGTRKRARDAKNYADSVGADWVGLNYDELNPETKDDYLKTDFNPLPGALGLMYEPQDVSIIIPLGIQNPDHQNVTSWIKRTYHDTSGFLYYAEIPYYTKAKNEEEFNDLAQGKRVFSIKKPKYTKGNEKYWKCFSDQSKFFFYNPPESFKDIPELILAD
jgi:LmbE family N-acetylglucosaminyl deacetylase